MPGWTRKGWVSLAAFVINWNFLFNLKNGKKRAIHSATSYTVKEFPSRGLRFASGSTIRPAQFCAHPASNTTAIGRSQGVRHVADKCVITERDGSQSHSVSIVLGRSLNQWVPGSSPPRGSPVVIGGARFVVEIIRFLNLKSGESGLAKSMACRPRGRGVFGTRSKGSHPAPVASASDANRGFECAASRTTDVTDQALPDECERCLFVGPLFS
jgi:hypothetical protein